MSGGVVLKVIRKDGNSDGFGKRKGRGGESLTGDLVGATVLSEAKNDCDASIGAVLISDGLFVAWDGVKLEGISKDKLGELEGLNSGE